MDAERRYVEMRECNAGKLEIAKMRHGYWQAKCQLPNGKPMPKKITAEDVTLATIAEGEEDEQPRRRRNKRSAAKKQQMKCSRQRMQEIREGAQTIHDSLAFPMIQELELLKLELARARLTAAAAAAAGKADEESNAEVASQGIAPPAAAAVAQVATTPDLSSAASPQEQLRPECDIISPRTEMRAIAAGGTNLAGSRRKVGSHDLSASRRSAPEVVSRSAAEELSAVLNRPAQGSRVLCVMRTSPAVSRPTSSDATRQKSSVSSQQRALPQQSCAAAPHLSKAAAATGTSTSSGPATAGAPRAAPSSVLGAPRQTLSPASVPRTAPPPAAAGTTVDAARRVSSPVVTQPVASSSHTSGIHRPTQATLARTRMVHPPRPMAKPKMHALDGLFLPPGRCLTQSASVVDAVPNIAASQAPAASAAHPTRIRPEIDRGSSQGAGPRGRRLGQGPCRSHV